MNILLGGYIKANSSFSNTQQIWGLVQKSIQIPKKCENLVLLPNDFANHATETSHGKVYDAHFHSNSTTYMVRLPIINKLIITMFRKSTSMGDFQ
jgi:hypothetical protein